MAPRCTWEAGIIRRACMSRRHPGARLGHPRRGPGVRGRPGHESLPQPVLTDQVWMLREVLLYRVPPWPQPAGL